MYLGGVSGVDVACTYKPNDLHFVVMISAHSIDFQIGYCIIILYSYIALNSYKTLIGVHIYMRGMVECTPI